ncbi:hypothetical protein V8C40DRAFT_241333 [Trichoderma camerunense]
MGVSSWKYAINRYGQRAVELFVAEWQLGFILILLENLNIRELASAQQMGIQWHVSQRCCCSCA